MCNAGAWPRKCWRGCASRYNVVALRPSDHRTKELLRVVGSKVWPVSNFAWQLLTTRNNMQQGVQTNTYLHAACRTLAHCFFHTRVISVLTPNLIQLFKWCNLLVLSEWKMVNQKFEKEKRSTKLISQQEGCVIWITESNEALKQESLECERSSEPWSGTLLAAIYTFLRLHEQIYLLSKNNKMCDRKDRLHASFYYWKNWTAP